jgi:tRNA A37 methylthiotransferase MiaB
LNPAESRAFVEALEAVGHDVAEIMDRSIDVAIVNSCAVTEQGESKCKETIQQIIRTQRNVALIITGCLADNNPQALFNCHYCILLLENSEKHRLVDHIHALYSEKTFQKLYKILSKVQT